MPSAPSFLLPDATPDALIRAIAANHRSWFTRTALTAGGEVRRAEGAQWTYTPGPGGEVVIPLPRIPQARQGAALDTILDFCRERSGELRQVSCWAATASGPRGLGPRLAARGFEYGWQSHWMTLALRDLPADAPVPEGVHIVEGDTGETDEEGQEDLPYYSREGTAFLVAQAKDRPRRTWRFAARRDGRVIGHVTVHLSTGRLGVAGIYNMGVAPTVRTQGVGRALMHAACRFAREQGCHHATLNSAADEFYYRLGWKSLGRGQTWWMHAPTLAAPPPTPAQVAFAEAVGLGDTAALTETANRGELPEELDAPLPNGMTLMALAVRAKKPAAARWLIEHGAALSVLEAWDLGWKKQAAQMLKAFPEMANHRAFHLGMTPLHEAAMRGDVELARLLLTANPDLSICDTAYNSTPLGWARHFNRSEIIALLEAHSATRSG